MMRALVWLALFVALLAASVRATTDADADRPRLAVLEQEVCRTRACCIQQIYGPGGVNANWCLLGANVDPSGEGCVVRTRCTSEGLQCDRENRRCVAIDVVAVNTVEDSTVVEKQGTPCLFDSDCNDGIFCNGAEICNGTTSECEPSPGDPCAGTDMPYCDEPNGICVLNSTWLVVILVTLAAIIVFGLAICLCIYSICLIPEPGQRKAARADVSVGTGYGSSSQRKQV